MQYTYNFPLKCAKAIQEFALEYTKDLVTDNVYVSDIRDMNPVLDLLNLELESFGLPKIFNVVIFKRKNCRLTPTVHIDSTSYDPDPIHASIVIPVEGYHGTLMYWMTGDYELQLSFTADRVAYKKIVWKSTPKLVNYTEIVDTTLCRVDLPHSATSRSDGSYRTIVSIRLQGNPSVEEILEKRNKT